MPATSRCVLLGNDLRGSVRAAYGADGSPACWFGDDVFGAPLDAQSGGDAALMQRLTRRYIGHAFETESGLYDYGARLYDPALARFPTPDPRHETPDPYAYCGNDPVNHVDPDGRGKTLVIVVLIQPSPVVVLFDNDAGGAYVGHIADGRHVHGVGVDRISRAMSEHYNYYDAIFREIRDYLGLKELNAHTIAGMVLPTGSWFVDPLRPSDTDSIGLSEHKGGEVHLFGLGRKSKILRRYIKTVGIKRKQWSALSLTLDEVKAAIKYNEPEFPLSLSESLLLRKLWTLRDYAGKKYRSRFAAHAKAVSNLDADLYYREGLLQAWTSWNAHLGEQLSRTPTPDPNATNSDRPNEPHSSDTSPSTDDHGQYRRGPSRRDEDDEPPRGGGPKSQWDNVNMTWKGSKPNYYGPDD